MVYQEVKPEIAFVERAHGALYEMIGRFSAALRLGKDIRHINNLRDDFKAVLNSHIEFENYIMVVNNYPLTYAHLEEHSAFKLRVDQLLDEAVRQGTGDGIEAEMHSLHDRHVEYYDDILCRYLTDKYHLQAVVDGLGI